ncbi:MAG: heavy metal transport/detoxification protein [Chitinophagaceae bacterium]|jgi:copper chaperone CopZ|nr:heavy metal transport/detoxification protein [Chitinophagaceae bacterium]
MENLQFKTNIKCSGCIAKSTPFLDKAVGNGNWNVDVQNPSKILTITSQHTVKREDVIKAVQEAGYTAEAIS